MFTKRELYMLIAGAGITFAIEEYRAFKFLKEAKDRFDEQSVALASLAERIELVEE